MAYSIHLCSCKRGRSNLSFSQLRHKMSAAVAGSPGALVRLATMENGASTWTFEPSAFEVVAIGPGCKPLLHNSVLVAPGVLTHAQCETLMIAADRWLELGEDDSCLRGGDEQEPLRRVRVSRMDADAKSLVEQSLLKIFALIERELPHTTRALFGDAAALSDTALRFAAAEPSVSVYTAGGSLYPHEDLEALTVLIPLSPPDAYEGGGTSFWPDGAERHPNDSPLCGDPVARPSCILKPPRGAALLYGGQLLHSAAEVTAGIRHIFVCSFSPSAPSWAAFSGGTRPAARHEASWGEARRRGRGILNERAVWTNLQGAFG